MITTTPIHFLSDQKRLFGTLYTPSGKHMAPGILFVHGAGKATSERYHPWQQYLAERGYASFSFDMRGVGKSDGEFSDGSLNHRLQDAEIALKAFLATGVIDENKLCFAGNSMGGHVVARLIEKNPTIKAVILGCAAAYGLEAEDKLLNEEFTEVIRKVGSWQDSPVFPILQKFLGKLCVVYGAEDTVIPPEVQKRFGQIAKTKGEAHILENIGHKLLQPETPAQQEAMRQLFTISANFLKEVFGE